MAEGLKRVIQDELFDGTNLQPGGPPGQLQNFEVLPGRSFLPFCKRLLRGLWVTAFAGRGFRILRLVFKGL